MADLPAREYLPAERQARPAGEKQRVAAVAEALTRAERPVIAAGGGTLMSEASEQLIALRREDS